MDALHRLIRDPCGGIAPIAAILGFVVIGFGAMAVDIGSFYLARRSLQGAADLAVIAAADALMPGASTTDNLTAARAAASAVLAANGYGASALVRIDLGSYSPDSSIAATQRFTVMSGSGTSGSGANGVRLAVVSQTPMFLGRIFLDQASLDQTSGLVNVGVTASAARSRFASFSIDSTLAALDGGIVNAILSAFLGSSVSLSVMSYDGLMTSQIDLFSFSKALAAQINFTGPNYDSLFNTDVKVSDILIAMARANDGTASGSLAASDALMQLARLAPSTTLKLSGLFNFGPFGQMGIGETPAIGAKVSVFGLLSEVLGVATGSHIVSSDLTANVPMIGRLVAYLSIGERPVNAPWVAIGAEGASIHTAQTRLLLDATVSLSPIDTLHIPIYIELASGTATLRKLSCEPVSAVVDTTPGLYSIWIGNVTPSLMANTTSIPNPGPAPVYNLANLGVVTALANSAVTNLAPTPLSFSQSTIANNTPQVAKTTNFTTSFVGSLLSTLQIGLNGIGILPGGLTSTIAGALAKVTSPLDSAINTVLTVLGVSLGVAQVHVSDVRCDGAVLVQ